MPFEFDGLLKGFILNMVDPLLRPDGYLLSLVRAEDLSPREDQEEGSGLSKRLNYLEINLNSSENEKLKKIQDFMCSRFKLDPKDFLQEIKNKSRIKSLIRDTTPLDDSLAGEYFHSHETKTAMKSIRLFNMNTLKVNTTAPLIRFHKSDSLVAIGDDYLKGDTSYMGRDRTSLFNQQTMARINILAGTDTSKISDSSLISDQTSIQSPARFNPFEAEVIKIQQG